MTTNRACRLTIRWAVAQRLIAEAAPVVPSVVVHRQRRPTPRQEHRCVVLRPRPPTDRRLEPARGLVGRQAVGLGRLQPRARQLVPVRQVLNPKRSADPVIDGLAALLVLCSAEVRQQVGVAPPVTAIRVPPGVEVEAVAAHVDHRVDRGAAAQRAAVRPVDGAAGGVPLRRRRVVPRVPSPPQPRESGRNRDLDGVVRRAGLEHENAAVPVLAQPRGEHAARAAGTNDHVVVHVNLVAIRGRCR
jgi:hypothetical protein